MASASRFPFWPRIDDGRGHEEVCADIRAQGFQLDRWADCLATMIRRPEWRNDGEPLEPVGENANDVLIECLDNCLLRPDAFRIRAEGPEQGWGGPVLACDVIEVVHSHAPDEVKYAAYERMWLLADQSHRLSLRFWETSHGQKFAAMTPIASRFAGDVVTLDRFLTLDQLLDFKVPR